MVKCPNCGHRSISPLQKFLSSRSRPIECRHCDERSATPIVAHYQFLIAVIYLAIFPHVLAEASLNLADMAVLTIIFAIKIFAPIRKLPIAG